MPAILSNTKLIKWAFGGPSISTDYLIDFSLYLANNPNPNDNFKYTQSNQSVSVDGIKVPSSYKKIDTFGTNISMDSHGSSNEMF